MPFTKEDLARIEGAENFEIVPIEQAAHDYTKDWLACWGTASANNILAIETFGPLDNYLETMPGNACDESVSAGHNSVIHNVNGLDTEAGQPQGSANLVQPDVKMLRATEIASKAADLVGGDRDRQHGAKRDNFGRIAEMWNAWLRIRRDPVAPLDAHDVGVMMTFMKMARTQSGNLNLDDYVDAAGYASCAGEVAQVA